MVHVPYKGTGPAINDLLAGQIAMMIDNMPALWPHVQSGKLRALAVSTEKRAARRAGPADAQPNPASRASRSAPGRA